MKKSGIMGIAITIVIVVVAVGIVLPLLRKQFPTVFTA
jgi:hypothetical protein